MGISLGAAVPLNLNVVYWSVEVPCLPSRGRGDIMGVPVVPRAGREVGTHRGYT